MFSPEALPDEKLWLLFNWNDKYMRECNWIKNSTDAFMVHMQQFVQSLKIDSFWNSKLAKVEVHALLKFMWSQIIFKAFQDSEKKKKPFFSQLTGKWKQINHQLSDTVLIATCKYFWIFILCIFNTSKIGF